MVSGGVLVHAEAVSDGTAKGDDGIYAMVGSGRAKDETRGEDRAAAGEPVRVTASEDGLSVTVPVGATALFFFFFFRLSASPWSTASWGMAGKVGSDRAAAELTNAGEVVAAGVAAATAAAAAAAAAAGAAAGAAFPSS